MKMKNGAASTSVSDVSKTGKDRSLLFLAVLMLVNALSYGTIIPLMYPYTQRFGLDAFGLSLLFASYSLFQFLATPIIGRLSDIYGRRPLLLGSLLGTGLSLALFASATTVWMLFLARILDGITGGNMSVAQAVIADKLNGKDRAKAFGMLGASFGFGFLIGPAIGGLLSEISLSAPFWFAAALATAATIFGYFFLPESLHPDHRSEHGAEPIFNIHKLVTAIKLPVRGLLILTIFITSLAMNNFIIGFQTYTNDVLDLSPKTIGLLFACSGLVNIIMQAAGIRFLLKKFDNHEAIVLIAEIGAAFFLGSLAFMTTLPWFLIMLFAFMFFNAPIMTIVSSMISERAHGKEQGEMLGISNSYMSLGQILGPILAGLIAIKSVNGIFLAGGLLMLVAFMVSFRASIKADLHVKVPGA